MSYFSQFVSQQIFTRVFTASTTWSPSQSGIFTVYVIGAGGSGAIGLNTSASGGGGGGCAIKTLQLSSSTTYTITIGAGGGSVGWASSGVATSKTGNAGGNTTFSGSGITTMTGGGGGAGQYGNPPTASTGGTASGGDYNYSGQGSPSTSVNYTGTGGGASGILGSLATPATLSNLPDIYRNNSVSWRSVRGGVSDFNMFGNANDGSTSVLLTPVFSAVPSGNWFCGGNGTSIYSDYYQIGYGSSGGQGGGGGGGVRGTGVALYQGWTGTGGDGMVIIEGTVL